MGTQPERGRGFPSPWGQDACLRGVFQGVRRSCKDPKQILITYNPHPHGSPSENPVNRKAGRYSVPPGKGHAVRLCATFVKSVNVRGRCGDGYGGLGLSLLVTPRKSRGPPKTCAQAISPWPPRKLLRRTLAPGTAATEATSARRQTDRHVSLGPARDASRVNSSPTGTRWPPRLPAPGCIRSRSRIGARALQRSSVHGPASADSRTRS